jgi:hypothetical protein
VEAVLIDKMGAIAAASKPPAPVAAPAAAPAATPKPVAAAPAPPAAAKGKEGPYSHISPHSYTMQYVHTPRSYQDSTGVLTEL